MAAAGPVQELCEEATCSICLDFFGDPVTIAECGHNFCRACLIRYWGEWGSEASCPQCRGRAQKNNLRPNLQLANFVEIIKKLSPLEGKGAGGKWGVCEKHQEPQDLFCKDDEAPLCVVCGRSKEHKDHEMIPLQEAFQENKAVVAARREGVCQKHQEPLKLFCKDDEALICVVCDRSKEHRNHETLPLEEASQEYKDQFCKYLEVLKKERVRIVAIKGNIVRKSEVLLKQTTGEKQEMVAKFKQLHTFLEEQEKLLLAHMEEAEKEVAKNRDHHLAELSEALSSLESHIRQLEEKCQQPASELLQDARTILQRYKESKTFENPATFPLALEWRILSFCDTNHLLEGIRKHLKDTLDSALHPQKAASVTLDPNTAHPQLILSKDQKSVRYGKKIQALSTSPERFDEFCAVLGREGFTAGHHFWEVLVGSEGEWIVGVARKSMRRNGDLTFSPEGGIWAMGKFPDGYMALSHPQWHRFALNGELRKILVCLNYEGGRVSFFNAESAVLLYEFSGASFSGETLLPFFWVRLKGYLQLS